MAKRKTKVRSRKAKPVRARRAVTARKSNFSAKANIGFRQPFAALQNGFSSFMNYFK